MKIEDTVVVPNSIDGNHIGGKGIKKISRSLRVACKIWLQFLIKYATTGTWARAGIGRGGFKSLIREFQKFTTGVAK